MNSYSYELYLEFLNTTTIQLFNFNREIVNNKTMLQKKQTSDLYYDIELRDRSSGNWGIFSTHDNRSDAETALAQKIDSLSNNYSEARIVSISEKIDMEISLLKHIEL